MCAGWTYGRTQWIIETPTLFEAQILPSQRISVEFTSKIEHNQNINDETYDLTNGFLSLYVNKYCERIDFSSTERNGRERWRGGKGAGGGGGESQTLMNNYCILCSMDMDHFYCRGFVIPKLYFFRWKVSWFLYIHNLIFEMEQN